MSQIKASEREIGQLAYELWEKAGAPNGENLRFWFEAEKQIACRSDDQDEALERGLEGSMPASDPPSEIQRSEKP